MTQVKEVAPGSSVGYGRTWMARRPTRVATVAIGYADGVPRAAGNLGPVTIGGRRFTVSGRVCMDQFVVDVGDLPVSAGDPVVLFGSGRSWEM